MLKLENLTARDIELIIVAVDAINALPSSGLREEDDARYDEWKALADKLKAQAEEQIG